MFDEPKRKRSIRVILADSKRVALFPMWSIKWITAAPEPTGRPPHSPAKSLVFIRGYSTGFGVMETVDQLEELMEG